jgi:hypothetical protein
MLNECLFHLTTPLYSWARAQALWMMLWMLEAGHGFSLGSQLKPGISWAAVSHMATLYPRQHIPASFPSPSLVNGSAWPHWGSQLVDFKSMSQSWISFMDCPQTDG